MWIKDLHFNETRLYGADCHDSLIISNDGRTLAYYNLQNGDGSRFGDYRFAADENGLTPEEDIALARYGADAYFNIGGFKDRKLIKDLEEMIKSNDIDDRYFEGVRHGLELAIDRIRKENV
jgi:hypothetical protein